MPKLKWITVEEYRDWQGNIKYWVSCKHSKHKHWRQSYKIKANAEAVGLAHLILEHGHPRRVSAWQADRVDHAGRI